MYVSKKRIYILNIKRKEQKKQCYKERERQSSGIPREGGRERESDRKLYYQLHPKSLHINNKYTNFNCFDTHTYIYISLILFDFPLSLRPINTIL